MSSTAPTRRCPFATIRGSNSDFRSRGTESRTGPDVVVTVFPEEPFREFPVPFPAGSPFT